MSTSVVDQVKALLWPTHPAPVRFAVLAQRFRDVHGVGLGMALGRRVALSVLRKEPAFTIDASTLGAETIRLSDDTWKAMLVAHPRPSQSVRVPESWEDDVDTMVSEQHKQIQKAPPLIVNSFAALQRFNEHAGQVNAVGLDAEGVNLSRTGKLTLLQLALPVGDGSSDVVCCNVYLFDMLLALDIELRSQILDSLKRLLESKNTLKICHDCRQDSAALWHQLNIRLTHVFDTSVACTLLERRRSHSQQQDFGVRYVGLNELLERFDVAVNSEKRAVSRMMKVDSSTWAKRPLTAQLIQYAAGDVCNLLTLSHRMESALACEAKEKLPVVQLSQLHCHVFRDATDDQAARPSLAFFRESNVDIPVELDLSWLLEMGFEVPCTYSLDRQLLVFESDTKDTRTTTSTADDDKDSFTSFLSLLPDKVRELLERHPNLPQLMEVALDVDRCARVRWVNGSRAQDLTTASDSKDQLTVTREMLSDITRHLTFGDDHRAGLPGALHRISAIYNKQKNIVGLTYRLGRSLQGMCNFLLDIVAAVPQKSVLLLGPPGCGKTTVIRNLARCLAEERNVVIVDTSCEIGGDGDLPHVSIGRARRLQVASLREQEHVMIEAVQNHTPDVVVVDEIGRSEEVRAARTISQRGVSLIASAHGSLASLLKNPTLVKLLGGTTDVILSDAMANRTASGEKVQLRRQDDPIFDVVVEFVGKKSKETVEWAVHTDVSAVVDAILQRAAFRRQVRAFSPSSRELRVRMEWQHP